MYHSVTFGSKNTFTDWHLVPDGRPVISMPELKKVTVDIPGRNSVLDLSQAVSKYPVFNNRTGTLKFHVLNGYGDWQSRYTSIAEYIHGKNTEVRLEDDPLWYYRGRVYVKEWTSNNDGTWSDISFDYDLEPYKLANKTVMTGDWLWDPFSFVNGNIRANEFKDIVVDNDNYRYLWLMDKIGVMPVTPTIYVDSRQGIDFIFNNPELDIKINKFGIQSGTYTWPEVVFTNMNEFRNLTNDEARWYTSHVMYKKTVPDGPDAKFSIDFRRGSL